jgi:hypothetical protein
MSGGCALARALNSDLALVGKSPTITKQYITDLSSRYKTKVGCPFSKRVCRAAILAFELLSK